MSSAYDRACTATIDTPELLGTFLSALVGIPSVIGKWDA
jgi:hypothetical protein